MFVSPLDSFLQTPLEKFDLHYLFFRNGLHCSDVYRHIDDTPRVSALPSKTLFELKLASYGKLPPTRLQNDVIACLNPVLTAFPYADPRDNDGLEAVRADLLFVPDEMRALRLPAAENGDAANTARARKAIVTVGAVPQGESKAHDLVKTAAFQALHGLIFDFGVIDEAFGWHVFVRLRAGGDRVIFNKLIMPARSPSAPAPGRTGLSRRRRRHARPRQAAESPQRCSHRARRCGQKRRSRRRR